LPSCSGDDCVERQPFSSQEETAMTIHAMSKRFSTVSALALITFVLLVGPALAAPISYNVDLNTDNQFGGLKQTDVTGCEGDPAGQLACGPAAAVNSFVFLENVYPKTYDHKLTDQGKATEYENWVATANILAGAAFMGCAECNGGTSRQDFFDGKKKYLEQKAPGSTTYKTAGNPAPRSIGTIPFSWLFGELKAGEDVEVVVTYLDANGNRIAGHFLTLTDLHWTDTQPDNVVDRAENARMSFVDPATGSDSDAQIYQKVAGGSLFSSYGSGLTVDDTLVAETRIDYAVSESPVPAPATALLLASAFGSWIIVLLMKRRSR